MRNFRKEAKAFWVVIGLIVLANIETSQFIQLSGNNYSLRRLRAEVFSYVTQVRDLLAGSCQSVEGEFFEAGYKVQFKGNFYPQDSDHPLLKDKGKAFFWMRISKDGEGVGYIVLYPGKDSYQIETAVCTSYNWQGNALAIKNLLLGVTPLKIEEKRFHPETYKQLESRLSGIIYYQELNRIKNDWPVYLKEYFLGKIREVLEKQSLLEEIPEGLAYLDKIQSYKEEFEQETELKELQNLGREFMDLTADFLRRSSQLKDYLPQFLDLRYEMLGKPEFFSYIKVIEEIKKIQEEEVKPGSIQDLLADLGEQTMYFGTYYKIWQAYNKMGEDFDLVKKYRKFLEENPGKPLLAFIRLMEWINATLKKEDLPKDLAKVKDLAEEPGNIENLLADLGEQTMYFGILYKIWQAYNKMGEDFDLVKRYRRYLEEVLEEEPKGKEKPLLAFIRLMEWINATLKKEDLPKDLAEVKDLAEKPGNIDSLLADLGEQTMYFGTYYKIWQAYKDKKGVDLAEEYRRYLKEVLKEEPKGKEKPLLAFIRLMEWINATLKKEDLPKDLAEVKNLAEEPVNIDHLLANLGEQTRYFGTYYKIWQAYNKMGEDFDLVKKYRKFLEENPGKPLLAFIRLMEWINDTLKKEDLPKDLAEVKDLAEKPVNIDHLLTNLGEQTMYFSTYYTIWQAYKGIIDERFSELLRQTHNNAYEAFNLFWKELIENAPNAEIKALVEVGTSVSELLRNLGFSVGLEIYAYVDREGRLVISNNFNQLILEKVDLDGIDGLLSQIEGEVARLQREGRLSLENRVIEYKSVEIAKYFEQQREVKLEDIQDMSDPTEKNGFDLKTKLGEEERYIEVKGRSFDGLNRIIITLTPNQINVASEEEKKDKYYLYIVIWIDNKPFLYIIKDPYKLFEQILDEG